MLVYMHTFVQHTHTQYQHELAKMQLRILKLPLHKTQSEGAYYKL